MVTTHYQYFPCDVDWHVVVDDFGNVAHDHSSDRMLSSRSWWNAYRFANVVSFEEAGMCSYNQAVSEH